MFGANPNQNVRSTRADRRYSEETLAADALLPETRAKMAGVAVDERRYVGTDPAPEQGLRFAAAHLETVLDEQTDLLHKLYAALQDSGLLSPEPADVAGAGQGTKSAPPHPRFSSRLLESVGRVGVNNQGIAYILSRLDL